MKAVIWTDVFQIMLTVIGVVVILVYGSILEGGMGNVWRVSEAGGKLDMFEYTLMLAIY